MESTNHEDSRLIKAGEIQERREEERGDLRIYGRETDTKTRKRILMEISCGNHQEQQKNKIYHCVLRTSSA